MGETTKSGLYKGPSHDEGGIPAIVDGIRPVEIEGGEFYLCSDLLESNKHYEFTDVTNRQVLESLFQDGHCTFDQSKAHSGDFIICKLAVSDKTKRSYKGTLKSILTKMQIEHGCKPSYKSGGEVNKKGGEIKQATEEELRVRTEKKREKIKILSDNIQRLRLNTTLVLKEYIKK